MRCTNYLLQLFKVSVLNVSKMCKKEIWKDIPNYEGIYQVSTFGSVRSMKFNKVKTLKQSVNSANKGYLKVNLFKNKKSKTFNVHQLMAITFLYHKPNGFKVVVDHIDENPLNNNLDNLQLLTNRENVSKGKKGGTSKYTGVYWHNSRSKWGSQITINGKHKHLGYFDCELKAADTYNKKLLEISFKKNK